MNAKSDAHTHPCEAGDACCSHTDDRAPRVHLGSVQTRCAFKIVGMDCADEVVTLKRAVGPIVGGDQFLLFDILNAKMTVVASATIVDPDRVRAAVAKTGMKAEAWSDAADKKAKEVDSGFAGPSGVLLLLGLVIGFWTTWLEKGYGGAPSFSPNDFLQPSTAAFAASIAYGLWAVLPKAWFSLRTLRPDINLLMVIAVVGAIAINQWSEAATVAFLFALSLTIESWSVERARNAIAKLLDLSPPSALLLAPDGSTRAVLPAQVAVGSRLLVKPGERFALDGRVVKGTSFVDQAPITGESTPVVKEVGANVFAGSINGDGALEVESTKLANDTMLAQVARLVGEAQSKRAASEQWVERFARYYTPAVMALAILVAVVPALIDGQWHSWFYNALVLLVIACPCALVISTPVSIVAALASAARQGVLIKGGVNVETPAAARVVAFDKTGTLTEGKPRVFSVTALAGYSKQDVLLRAASLESQSTHPIARAILAEADKDGIVVPVPTDVKSIQGKGTSGAVLGAPVWIGSARLRDEKNLTSKELIKFASLQSGMGHSVVYVGNDNEVCGVITVADPLKANAAATVAALKKAGIERVIMLSGDNLAAATTIGHEAGVDEVHSDLLPADKIAEIKRLKDRYGPTIMVGDGVNDAPAMAGATVGVAMGAAGSDTAIEAADIALMSDDISRLPWLIAHSKRTLGVIWQNIGFSLGIKVLFAGMTLFGLATLWGAVAADVGASLLVTLNGLRLLQAKNLSA